MPDHPDTVRQTRQIITRAARDMGIALRYLDSGRAEDARRVLLAAHSAACDGLRECRVSEAATTVTERGRFVAGQRQ